MFTAGLILLFAPSCRNPSPVGPVPPNFQLNQNFPNPFTDSTTVQYGVPANASGEHLILQVFDAQRSPVRILENAVNHPSGTFQVSWDGRDASFQRVPPGLYIIELRSGEVLSIDGGMNGVYGRIMAVRR
jgi:hypothetical protein